MNIFQDIIDIFTSFGIVDYILYIAVVTLIILIVSLIYVMKNENESSEEVVLKASMRFPQCSGRMRMA